MTITIKRNNQIITIRRIPFKDMNDIIVNYFYKVIPLYYRSKQARADVDKILKYAGMDFITFIKEARI